ncbi:MAG: flagellar hook assembly protein FlgD [Spirochaetaceae bacterium]|jgi:flagellar basal-body rod modification protein FlgD|nr:flagellar hook assembly protein FlgD [Spirochaetaceae bacterium]
MTIQTALGSQGPAETGWAGTERTKITARLDAQEKAEIARLAEEHNQKVNQGRNPQKNLGKDDFLKLLITQLSYQDPTAPMEDKEFIAQMAQFSTLDQMTSMAADFTRLTAMLSEREAAGALGKTVEIRDGDAQVRGAVKAVARGAPPEILVNGAYYAWDQVTKVFEE